jgi:hypothetical protein
MSALGQKQTYAMQPGMSALPPKATCAVQLGMSALGPDLFRFFRDWPCIERGIYRAQHNAIS